MVDVKFPPRGDGKTVIVKFSSKEAADTFIELDYIMFFGTELTRNIVGQYLKGKTLDQKNEISMLLLGKKYVFGNVFLPPPNHASQTHFSGYAV